ncbi:MAG: cupredoxin domain-containing protein [Actinomycetota bacterium]
MQSIAARGLVAFAAFALVVTAGLMSRQPLPDYVVTAIDYHFHDAHPTLPLGPGRDLVVKNASENVHNVTIPAGGFSRDVNPGGQLRIPDIAELLGGPGSYSFYCAYHRDRGMAGVIVIGGS